MNSSAGSTSGTRPIATERTTDAAAWRTLGLLALAMFISYIDRGNLATVLPRIEQELGLSKQQLGTLGSAFYLSYVPTMIVAGWLAERYGAQRVLTAGFAIWSVATLLSGWATGFGWLVLCRLLLGIGESVSFPCMSKIIASLCTQRTIGGANALASFGYLVGPGVGTLLGGLLMVQWGWRWSFWAFGALALLWLVPWQRARIAEVRLVDAPSGGPTLARLLRQRALWAAALGHFAGNYTYYFVLSWLPEYLFTERHTSLSATTLIAAMAYLLNALGAVLAGLLADRRARAGRSAGTVYKALMALNHGAALFCVLGLYYLPLTAAVAALFLYQFVVGLSSPGYFAIPQILAGPTAAARWVGIQNACGNLAGIIGPALTGWLIAGSGSFATAFTIAAAINILGFVGWVILLPRIEPIDWEQGT